MWRPAAKPQTWKNPQSTGNPVHTALGAAFSPLDKRAPELSDRAPNLERAMVF